MFFLLAAMMAVLCLLFTREMVCCHGFQISFSSEFLGFGLWKQID